MRKYILVTVILIIIVVVYMISQRTSQANAAIQQRGIWQFQSVDTMKYSRDLSRQELQNPNFDKVINQQMQEIASTGATYVAIGTPYDDEFLPILRRWVASARAHHLHVWFRGNFSGWEGWFGYPNINRSQHTAMTKAFILNNADLFQNGDVFTACPECENGGPGDPRQTGDVVGFRTFLIDEYHMTQDAFSHINKHVASNYNSMNEDVAQLIMDKSTTKALGGVVTIDHYVETGKQMASDVEDLATQSGGKIVIGEFGAPIPDIQGNMTEREQANWIEDALYRLANTNDVIGVNYWTSVGGSTSLWNSDGKAKQAVQALTNVYTFHGINGTVVNALGQPLADASVRIGTTILTTNSKGNFYIPYVIGNETVMISAPGYFPQSYRVNNKSKEVKITLVEQHEDIFFTLEKLLHF